VPGDDDGLDVCEIGSELGYTGQVKQVKVLGAMALLDEGETDWKVIVIDVKDSLAPRLTSIADVCSHMPGLLDAMKYWFSVYKVPDGKQRNRVALGGQIMEEEYVYAVQRVPTERCPPTKGVVELFFFFPFFSTLLLIYHPSLGSQTG
jgi:inorganic pyrophosphatase